jgi:hypothetical protein
MAASSIPLVAVIGGLWNLEESTAAKAREAGKSIGEALAKAGFGLLVYFSDEKSLEPHVVSGYVAALPDGAGVVCVRFVEEDTAKSKIFDRKTFPGDDWEAPFYRSLAEEDQVNAVLLVSGADSTLIAGQIALARKLPILAVNAFGGSAAKIWRQLAYASPKLRSWGSQAVEEFVEQLKKDCEAAVERKAENRRRDEIVKRLNSQNSKAFYAAPAFILLLVTLFFGMVYTPIVSAYPIVMFGGLIAAGATGALVRSILSPSTETDPRTSLLLGGIAGFVVGLAYLIPQWVGAPGVLDVKATAVTWTDKIQFASAVLVAISAGVGFDTVFTRLQKQAQDAAIGPPR